MGISKKNRRKETRRNRARVIKNKYILNFNNEWKG